MKARDAGSPRPPRRHQRTVVSCGRAGLNIIPEQRKIKFFILDFMFTAGAATEKRADGGPIVCWLSRLRTSGRSGQQYTQKYTHSRVHAAAVPARCLFIIYRRRSAGSVLLLGIHAARRNHTGAAPQSNSPAAAEHRAGPRSSTGSQYNRQPGSPIRGISTSANR